MTASYWWSPAGGPREISGPALADGLRETEAHELQYILALTVCGDWLREAPCRGEVLMAAVRHVIEAERSGAWE